MEQAQTVVVRSAYYPGAAVMRLVSIIIGIIETIIAIRLVLELLAANASSQFVAWIYSVSQGLMGPFSGAFPALALGGGATLDFSALLAMVGYAILGWIVGWLLSLLFA